MNTSERFRQRSAADIEWNAHWVWHRPLAEMDNFHLLARKTFTIDGPAENVVCHISCNSIYELWVNGTMIGRGPNPSFPGFLYFDSHDITAKLVAGDNVIALRCYNFGPTMQSTLGQNPGPGGLIVQVQAGDKTLLSTDSTWKVLQDPSREQQTEPISGHRGGFKELCDGRRAVAGWQRATFDDSKWSSAYDLGPADAELFGRPIPREIPPLRVTTTLPINAYSQAAGCTYGGKKNEIIRPEAVLADDDAFTIIDPLQPDVAPSLLLDFGSGVYGQFEIDFADGGAGGGVVELSYGESLNLTLVDRYILRPGPQTYAPFERRGGRYLRLTFRNCDGPVCVRRVVCHEQSYAVEPRGHFSCSDPLLNRIWSVACETSRSNMQDHFEDAPWREQTLYAGDVHASALIAYYAWGDAHLARKCLRQFARLQNDAGLIPLFGPAPKPTFVLPEYPALWVASVWNHYLHWGDNEFLQELWPAVERCLAWYAKRLDEHGLFKRTSDEPWGVFIDNLSNITATADLAAEQMFYVYGLRSAAKMAAALEKRDAGDRLNRQADELSRQIEKCYWSDAHDCLIDSRVPGDAGVTQITNGLALLFDIVHPSRRYRLEQVLMQRDQAPPIRAGYAGQYMVDALLHHGRTQEAVDRIREYWGGMIEHGATSFWEVFDPESPDGTLPQRLWSLSHAFCAGPAYSLPAGIVGVRPLTPGYAHVQIQPKINDLSWLSATVPVPRGEIRVQYLAAKGSGGSRQLDIDAPAETDVDLVLETPGRDIWSIWINGTELAIDRDGRPAEGSALKRVHPQLVLGQLHPAGVLLRFAGAQQPLRVRCEVRQCIGSSGRRIVVTEPGNNWDAAPKPAGSAAL